jgi:Ran-binding protein 1
MSDDSSTSGGFGGFGGFSGFGVSTGALGSDATSSSDSTSTSASTSTSGGDDGGDAHHEEENQTAFEPVIHLKEVVVDSGESNEEVLYKQRCALYRYAPEGDVTGGPPIWKERGRGDAKLLKHKTTALVRIVLREDKTLKLRLNHIVKPGITLSANPGSDRFWSWRTADWAEYDILGAAKTDTFGIKFKTSEVANEFKTKWDEARELNATTLKAIGKDDSASSDTASSSTSSSGSSSSSSSTSSSSSDSKKDSKSAADTSKTDQLVWHKIIQDRKFKPLTKENLKALWAQFDKDGSSSIDATELKTLFKSLFDTINKDYLHSASSAEVTAAVEAELPGLVQKALKQLDKNNDGKLSFDEFASLNEVKGFQ